MKKVLLAALAALSLSPAMAQRFSIDGVCDPTATMAYLKSVKGRIDSVAVKGGTFHFEGDASGHCLRRVYTNIVSWDTVTLITDGEHITVDLTKGTVGGTPENDALNPWLQRMVPHKANMREVLKEFTAYKTRGEQMPDSIREAIISRYEAEEEQCVALARECCEANKQHIFPLFFLVDHASSMPRETVIALAEEGDPAYMKVDEAGRLRQQLKGWKRQAVGQQYTDLEMPDAEGKMHKLSEFVGNGKYLLVDFWASWCGPCRAEMPHVKAAYEKYKDKGFDVVGLSFDEDKDAWTGAIKRLGLPWHHLSDLKGWRCVAGEVYGINSIPATLLIGPDGTIVAGGLRGEELEKKLSELLK